MKGLIMQHSKKGETRARQPVGAVSVHGFVRLGFTDVAGRHKGRTRVTKWYKNVLTADGLQNYVCGSAGAVAGSKQVSNIELATQTAAPVTTQTSASGEFTASGHRKTTTNTFAASGTLRCVASWATNEGNESAVGAVALYNTTSGGTCGSVATFTASQKTTDQTLSITYEWRFSTA